MKKIGILTFHKSINYGSVLQAWALSKTLDNYDVEIVNYEPDIYKENYGVFSFSKGIKYNLNRLFNYHAINRQIKLFSDFRKKHLKMTETIKSKELSEKIFDKYDAVITGSDQIWNVHADDADDVFFLPYNIKAKKIAYACSVNNTDFTEKRCDNRLRSNILDYDFISIRENSGALKVSDFLNEEKKVFNVLDPTLLNTKEDYKAIVSKRIVKKRYIFLYNVWSGSEVVDVAKRISEKMEMPVYTAMTTPAFMTILRIERKGIKVEKKYTSPQDFLSLIKYSDFVITDSFHGTAFSLIFEKNFVSINGIDKQGKLKNDERLINVLSITGLMDRYICKDDIEKFNFKKEIDYKIVTYKRMQEADRCKNMLIEAIEGVVRS